MLTNVRPTSIIKPWMVILLLIALALTAWYVWQPDFLPTPAELTGQRDDAPKRTRVYKWADANGQWQVSDQPPPQGTPYEILEYRDDVNVLPVPPALQPE